MTFDENLDDTDLDGADLAPLSAADEAFVHDLLASLPPVQVPDDLVARLDSALREAADEPRAEPIAGVGTVGTTVVALDQARARSRLRRTRVLQVAAACLLGVAGVLSIVKLAGSGTVAQTSTGAGASTPAPAVEKSMITRSGHTYSDATLVSDVRALASHKTLSSDSSSTGGLVPGTPGTTFGSSGGGTRSATAQPEASGPPADGAVATRSGLVACLAAVEEGLPEPVTPLAVDQGTYRGQAALVVVLPGSQVPKTTYDVFVVGISCGENADAHLLTYQLVEIH